MISNPIYISKKGGTINCYKADDCFLYIVYFENLYQISNDLLSAMTLLGRLENLNKKSGKLSLKIMKKKNSRLKRILEDSAAPYIDQ